MQKKENTRYFQYLAGSKKKEIVIFNKIETEEDMIFVTFTDGSRCNEELIIPINDKEWNGKFMAEIENPKNCWKFAEEWIGRKEEKWEQNKEGEKVCVQPYVEGKLKIIPIFPKPSTSKFGFMPKEYDDSDSTVTTIPIKLDSIKLDSFDPVYLMIEKAKKFDTKLELNLIIALPKKSLYDIVEESYEKGGEKMIEYILENTDTEILKDTFKKALLEKYKNTKIIE